MVLFTTCLYVLVVSQFYERVIDNDGGDDDDDDDHWVSLAYVLLSLLIPDGRNIPHYFGSFLTRYSTSAEIC